jgi:hypothetical protein
MGDKRPKKVEPAITDSDIEDDAIGGIFDWLYDIFGICFGIIAALLLYAFYIQTPVLSEEFGLKWLAAILLFMAILIAYLEVTNVGNLVGTAIYN